MAKTKSKKMPLKSTKPISTPKDESKGLGDTVEKVFEATGIAKVAKFILGEDCGCDKRKEVLNKMFPYNKPECLTETEYEYLDHYFKNKKSTITGEQQKRIIEIYNRVFHENAQGTSCPSCFLNSVQSKLKKVYDEYER